MKVLLIGATGFIGPYIIRRLAAEGHEITVFHRGKSHPDLPRGTIEILGDRNELTTHREALRRLSADVVVDLILSSGRQAHELMNVFRGHASRIIALSSGDVYRACGIFHGSEPGPLQPVPLMEESELRTKRNVYGPELLEGMRVAFPWLDDEYDKIAVEEAVMNGRELPGTVLRLPMVYGPRDPLHRLFPYLKRMDDGRPAILLQEDAAQWRAPRGYVENVAAAISLTARSAKAAGKIYNIAEPQSLSEIEWVRRIARAANWNGAVLPIAKELTPSHLRVRYNSRQHWEMSSPRIREELGFSEPIDTELALRRTTEWERTNPPAQIDTAQFDYTAEDAAVAQVGKNAAPAPVR